MSSSSYRDSGRTKKSFQVSPKKKRWELLEKIPTRTWSLGDFLVPNKRKMLSQVTLATMPKSPEEKRTSNCSAALVTADASPPAPGASRSCHGGWTSETPWVSVSPPDQWEEQHDIKIFQCHYKISVKAGGGLRRTDGMWAKPSLLWAAICLQENHWVLAHKGTWTSTKNQSWTVFYLCYTGSL